MGILNIFKKNDKSLEDSIVENIAKGVNAEKAVITYLLLQARENNISLAKKEDMIYVRINNKILNDFLNEWYTLLQMHQKKKLSDKMYNIYINNQLAENKLTEDKKTSDNEDDFD